VYSTPLLNRLQTWLWTQPPRSKRHAQALVIARYMLALLRDLLDDPIHLYASSLVYTSLLSLVPFLAIGFSLLKALGAQNTLEPALRRLLTPFGSKASEISRDIIGFVDNVQVGVLGFVGVAMLLYTVVSLIQKVEASFNRLWQLPSDTDSPQRLGEFLALMIVGPVLVFTATGVTGTVIHSQAVDSLLGFMPVDLALLLLSELAFYLLIAAIFSFLYFYIPRTPVKPRAALIAGFVSGLIWQAAGALFAQFTSGASNYNAIYSGFAVVMFVLLWLDLAWLILLCGCRLSYYLQYPRQMLVRGGAQMAGSRETEWTALLIAVLVFDRFARARAAPTRTDLHHVLGAPGELIERCVDHLVATGILAEVENEHSLLPARDAQTLSFGELWLKVRGLPPAWSLGAPAGTAIAERLAALEQDAASGSARESLHDWLNRINPPS